MRLKNSRPNRGGGIIMNSNDLAVAADISKNILFSQLRALESANVGSDSSSIIPRLSMSPSSLAASLVASGGFSYPMSSKRSSGGASGKVFPGLDDREKLLDSTIQGKN